ncbi:MAG: phosphatidylinositol 3 and 4-kinase-domain-containing protein [Monoraphidium minutum]|nr:MAG: phosphatidylinositol 3 and 4-kinase-domain-containing protein [Monoraphidium minutum]
MALARVAELGTPPCCGVVPRPGGVMRSARVFLAVPAAAAAAAAELQEPYTSLEVMPEESIKDLKLRLLNRGFSRPPGASSCCLVFGDLDEAARAGLAQLAGAAGPAAAAAPPGGGEWLHIFAPAAAVESVSVRTPLQEFSLGGGDGGGGEPAPAALARLALPLARAAAAAAAAAGGDAAAAAAAAAGAPAVVHLLVHKSARVAWRHMADGLFELSISGAPEPPPDAGAAAAAEPELAHKAAPDAGRPLASYGIRRGAPLTLLPLEPPAAGGPDPGDTLPDGSPRLASPLHQLHTYWIRAAAGLLEGRAPRLAPAGTGGCYFLHDNEGNPVGVFKPADEEPLAAHNPKGRAAPHPADLSAAAAAALAGAGAWALAGGAPAPRGGAGGAAAAAAGGEGAIVGGAAAAAAAAAPVAAWLLDHGRFAGVPATAMVQLQLGGAGGRAKVGSLQQFVAAESDCEERGVSEFPPSEVHKIAVLDLRLGNTDRNGANILARRGPGGAWELVPIDHGSCLPDTFEDLSFEWAWWPQASVPFDDRTLAYIASLDADRDAAALAAHGLALRPECLRALRVCTMLLQRGAAAGLTAAQIARVASRQALARSPLERMHAAAASAAAAAAGGGVDEGAYLQAMGRLIDDLLGRLDDLDVDLEDDGLMML